MRHISPLIILFAIAASAEEILSTAELPDTSAIDWEDMAIGPGPDKRFDYLYLADFGNNLRKKKEFQIYRTPEPKVIARPQFNPAKSSR